jgi:hypothetical protein
VITDPDTLVEKFVLAPPPVTEHEHDQAGGLQFSGQLR